MNAQDQATALLADVPAGGRGQIVSVSGGEETERRLTDVGLSLGSKVEVLVTGRRCPVLVAVGDTRVAIESDLAHRVHIHACNRPACGRNDDGARDCRSRRRRRRGWRLR